MGIQGLVRLCCVEKLLNSPVFVSCVTKNDCKGKVNVLLLLQNTQQESDGILSLLREGSSGFSAEKGLSW